MTTFHAGFDTKCYPTLATMQSIKQGTNLTWCAYYLAPTPTRKDASWVGKRAELVELGWGLAPVYLGQQWAACEGNFSGVLRTSQGTADAAGACRLAAGEGFPAGTYIYLDWENGACLGETTLPDDLAAYMSAFAIGVTAGGYAPGFYCSHNMGDAIDAMLASLDAVQDARLWVYKVSATCCTYEGNPQDFPTPDPAEAYRSAGMWQHMQDCSGAFSDFTADLNSSLWRDPGSK